MPEPWNTRRPPDIPQLLAALSHHNVRFVLTGSVAASLYGVDIGMPGDLDITSALDLDNLNRLAELLLDIEAHPEPELGHWHEKSDGELEWITEEANPDLLAANAQWKPDPSDPENMDHLYQTRLGNFDIVPRIGGTYDALAPRAVRMIVSGYEIPIAHIDDLLAHITVPRRAKDVPRVRQLREIQRERGKTPQV